MIYVPICYADYSNKYIDTDEIDEIEKYLCFFAKDWPMLYEVYDKDENGITPDGLQKDGTGAYNKQNVSTTNEKYNVKLLKNTSYLQPSPAIWVLGISILYLS